MQLNRLKYENGNAVKVMTPLNIEKTIYPDRFMIENREVSERLHKNVQGLRDKIKHLEKCMAEYKSFQGSDYNIHKMLGLTSTFFEMQNSVS
jgi:hypothetical protein